MTSTSRIYLVASLILLAVFGWYARGIDRVPFHPDETSWIYMSRDLDAIMSLDWSRLVWHRGQLLDADSGYRLLNAPLPKYVIGIGRRLGPDEARLADWNWHATMAENRAAGAVPSPSLLTRTRLASAAATALSIALFFTIAYRLGGWPTAIAATALLATHPLELLHTRRAMAEGSAQLFELAAVLAIVNASLARRRVVAWSIAVGIALGAAIAAKQHFAALAPVGALVALAAPWSPPTVVRVGARAFRRAAWSALCAALVAGAMLTTFFVLNPVMYAQPRGSARLMWTMRWDFLKGQVDSPLSEGQLLPTVPARLRAAATAVVFDVPESREWTLYGADEAANDRAGIFDRVWNQGWIRSLFAMAIVLGAAVATGRAAGEWKRRWFGPSSVVILWAIAQAAFTALFVPLDWQRYFMPLVPPACLLGGIGVGWLVSGISAKKSMKPDHR